MWDMLKGSWLFLLILSGLSIYGAAIVVNKIIWIKKNTLGPKKNSEILKHIQGGDFKVVYEDLPDNSIEKKFIKKAVLTIQKSIGINVKDELVFWGGHYLQPMIDNLETLPSLANLSTLLGLLGTVVGMIGSFYDMMVSGDSNPYILAGGISMALITTAGGLIVAITLLLAHRLLKNSAKQQEADLMNLLNQLTHKKQKQVIR